MFLCVCGDQHLVLLAQKERRVKQPVFDAVIELDKDEAGEGVGEGAEEDEPRWTITIVKDVGGVVDELLATGAVYRPEIRTWMPLAEDDGADGDGDGDGDELGVVDEVRARGSGT